MKAGRRAAMVGVKVAERRMLQKVDNAGVAKHDGEREKKVHVSQ